MAEPRDPRELEASIQRVQDAISKGKANPVELFETVVAAAGAHAMDRVAEKLKRRLERRRAREERRLRRLRSGEPRARGVMLATAAVVCLVLAVTQPHLWWLVFVALGLGLRGVQAFGSAAPKEPALPAAQPTSEPAKLPPVAPAKAADPAVEAIAARVQRLDGACDRLLAELDSAPQAVRDFLQRPDETVKALRAASHELARREREVRWALDPADGERLQGERATLAGRAEAEKDPVSKSRLGAALEAEHQGAPKPGFEPIADVAGPESPGAGPDRRVKDS